MFTNPPSWISVLLVSSLIGWAFSVICGHLACSGGSWLSAGALRVLGPGFLIYSHVTFTRRGVQTCQGSKEGSGNWQVLWVYRLRASIVTSSTFYWPNQIIKSCGETDFTFLQQEFQSWPCRNIEKGEDIWPFFATYQYIQAPQ